MTPRSISRRKLLATTAAAGTALMARPMIGRADTKEVLIAEPVHGMGYLPLYVGMAKNLFDVVTSGKVKIVVSQTYPLKDAAKAHADLEGRKTTGSTVFIV